jgi:hypothetical protein
LFVERGNEAAPLRGISDSHSAFFVCNDGIAEVLASGRYVVSESARLLYRVDVSNGDP